MRRYCLRALTPIASGLCAAASGARRQQHTRRREDVTEEEMRHLEQELPPRELLQEYRTADVAPGDDENEVNVPGDSFGIMRNRVAFYKPIARQVHSGLLGELLPEDTHPFLCVNARTVRYLCGRYGVTETDAVLAMQHTKGDINKAVYALQRKYKLSPSFGDFGVVCLEAYAPETFCLVSYSLPSYEALLNDDVLDVIHELTLSAAELPLDVPKEWLVHKFTSEWTVEDDTPCAELLAEYDLAVKEIVLLPYGDYSVQGFFIQHPLKEDTPNIGVAAGACCIDLRTGIHNRFRFHVERIADSVSEHVVQEMIHYHQGVHVLRQPYFFRPEYSVEEFIRFKESLLQPSASTFEMRYAAAFAPGYNLHGFRNIVEMEKLKVAQHKYEKHYEDFTSPGNWLTSDNAQLQTVAAGGGGSNAPGGAMHANTNDPNTTKTAMETRTGPLRRTLERSMQIHGDRVFARFYRNNYH